MPTAFELGMIKAAAKWDKLLREGTSGVGSFLAGGKPPASVIKAMKEIAQRDLNSKYSWVN